MSATTLRTLWHVAALAIAALLFVLLPFSLPVKAACAIAFWIADSAAGQFVFNRLASTAEKQRDLRDRVDHPPS